MTSLIRICNLNFDWLFYFGSLLSIRDTFCVIFHLELVVYIAARQQIDNHESNVHSTYDCYIAY